MKKQSDLLLNADDLDTMWVCLRDNCVIDDATGAEKCFSPSNFMKFEKDESGRTVILPFYLYIMRTVSVPLPILTVQFYSLCTFQYHMIIAILKVSSCVQEMEAYIRGLIPNLPQLRDMPAQFVK
ncbi:probable serine/threonine-protein phosphatase 2A regulatory subunit B'' subunit TON2, partial [Tanacetum coccineum]